MSATLYFSNSAGILLDRLAHHVGQGDPFTAPRIATPTAALRRLVQMGLAERLGAAANLGFLHLERALWDCLANLDAYRLAPDREPARLLSPGDLQALLLAQILERPPEAAAQYLGWTAQSDPFPGGETRSIPRDADLSPAAWRKALQLSGRLAYLFREYEYSRVREHGREGLAALWLRGSPCFADYLDAGSPAPVKQRVTALESWQSDLYRDVFGPGGLRDVLGATTGRYLYTLPQYREMVFAQSRNGEGLSRNTPALDLFGLAQISPFHRSLIQQLADTQITGGHPTRFRIYSLNPCAEYWEDALDPRTRRRRMQQDLLRQERFLAWRHLDASEKKRLQLQRDALWAESLATDPQDNALLARWGLVGRENVQLWCQVTDYAFAGRFREPAGATLLASVQSAVLRRSGPLPAEERVAQDLSLRLMAAPEIHREIETVLHDMIERCAADPTLRPDEMAIMLTNAEAYGPVIETVFGARHFGDPGFLPYVRPEAGLRSSDAYLRGLHALAAMAQGEFDRPHLLDLIANPCCQARLGFDAASAESMAQWVAALNLFQGDAGKIREAGSAAAPPDPHRFLTGMRRLLLSLWMEAPGDGEGTSFQGYSPYAPPLADRETLASFCALVKALEQGLEPFLKASDSNPRGMPQWAEAFFGLADACLTPAAEAGDAAFVHQIQQWRQGLDFFDRARQALRGKAGGKHENALPEEALAQPKGLFLESLREAIAAANASGRPWLTGGVQVGSLEALRGLPFRVLYVPGLQEGDFPDEPLQSSLDLRQFRRVIGDLEPAARNRYSLLMALMQAGDAVMLSYVDRDLERDREKQRSSALGELVDYLETDILPSQAGKRASFRILRVSLDPDAAPAAVAEAYAAPPRHPFPEIRLFPPGPGRHPPLWGPQSSAAAGGLPGRQALPASLDVEDLVRYLKHPRRQTLKWRLKLSDRYAEAAEDSEPFALPDRLRRDLPRDCLAEAARQGLSFSLDECLSRRLKALRLQGALPPGEFGAQAEKQLRETTQTWWRQVHEALRESWGTPQAAVLGLARFGQGSPRPPHLPRLDFPAVSCAGWTWQGQLPFVWRTTRGGWGYLDFAWNSSKGSPSWTQWLKAFAFFSLATQSPSVLSQRLAEEPVELWLAPSPGKPGKPLRYLLRIDAHAARAWIEAVASRLQSNLQDSAAPLGPDLSLWQNLAGFQKRPWGQEPQIADAFRRQVRRASADALEEIEPGKSSLAETENLLPSARNLDPVTWAQEAFDPLLAAIRPDQDEAEET